jgi:hypothetical protein
LPPPAVRAHLQPWYQPLLQPRHVSNNASPREQVKTYGRSLFRIRFQNSTASYLRIWECANALTNVVSLEVSSQSKGAKEKDNNKKKIKVQKEKKKGKGKEKKKGEGKRKSKREQWREKKQAKVFDPQHQLLAHPFLVSHNLRIVEILLDALRKSTEANDLTVLHDILEVLDY